MNDVMRGISRPTMVVRQYVRMTCILCGIHGDCVRYFDCPVRRENRESFKLATDGRYWPAGFLDRDNGLPAIGWSNV